MRILGEFFARLPLLVACCVLSVASCAIGNAQLVSPGSNGAIAGTVVDPSGAVVPNASITVTPTTGKPLAAAADNMGSYSVTGLMPGSYTIEAQAPGFRTTRKSGVRVTAGTVQRITLSLQIAAEQQQVVVSDSAVDTSPENNGGAIIMKGSDLQALSDDPDELQMQLQAIAGADPNSGAQLYVDGFSGGKMPPKSAIREIRINQNPYSAEFDQQGWGRIEVFTKPGTDKLHGGYWMQGNDSAFNTKNPFVTVQPPYHSYYFDGDVNGSIRKVLSFYTSIFRQSASDDSIVNAVVLDSSLNQTTITQAIPAPRSNLSFTPRFDWQWGKVQTLSVRYQVSHSTATNSGVGQFALASQAFNTEGAEQLLQFSDTQAYGAKLLNETRFQYIRNRNNQSPQTQGPTIAVQGAFTGGGSSVGVSHDNQDHYELQDYLHIAHGTHDLNMGGRLRAMRDSNYSTANFNGEYIFSSLAAYQITMQGQKNGLSPAAIRASGGGASMFTQTEGTPNVAVSLIDAGLYAEDNWKAKPNVTLSYGMRFETQTQIHDHADFGPRLSLSWAINGEKNKPPRAVVRAGYGLFYQRFGAGNVMQAERQNGVTEKALVVNSPDFYPAVCSTNPAACTGAVATSPTVYRINPTLRAPYSMAGSLGVDKPLGKYASLSANYWFTRGQHLFLTRNINAPLPGTYDPSNPASGVRPLGTVENIYEYESEGASEQNRVTVNGNLHTKKTGLYGYYGLSKTNTNTAGIGTFPSNQYDLHDNYGRASYDRRQMVYLSGYTQIYGKVSLNPFIFYGSSSPFNIVVGQDLNGDTQFNDRPAFATDLTRSSVYQTRWGAFDAQPMAGQKIIPVNYGKGPGMFVANLRLSRNFNFGPALAQDPPPAPAANAKDDKSAAKPPAKPEKKEVQRKYNLRFGVSADNVLNHVNLAQPVGVLGSPLFGKSTSLAGIFGSGSANRTIGLDMSFQF
jgi:hypothetical protein